MFCAFACGNIFYLTSGQFRVREEQSGDWSGPAVRFLGVCDLGFRGTRLRQVSDMHLVCVRGSCSMWPCASTDGLVVFNSTLVVANLESEEELELCHVCWSWQILAYVRI